MLFLWNDTKDTKDNWNHIYKILQSYFLIIFNV